jgi:TolB-like protein/class 3 adenylate cyclase/Flp pilus assembly protein TadD
MPEEQPQPTAAAQTRKLAAIMFTDIVGFSRQMGADEAHMLRLLDIHNQVIQQAVAAQRGTVIKIVGDAFLVDFPSVVHAVQCAQQIQNQFRSYNAEKEKTEQIHVRIGIHLGDVVQRDGDVFGDGVNIASRLQAFAEPDTICLSDMVYRDVAQKVPLGMVVSLGRPRLKNIAQRFPVYALLSEPSKGLRRVLRVQYLRLSRRVGAGVLVLVSVFLIGGLGTFLFPSLSLFRIPQSEIRNQEAQPPLPLPDKPSIVVLPFDNMSGDPGQKYFSDGITEVLTSDLSRISSLFVIARNTAFTYDGKPVNVQEVGKELGVRYVLEGSVQKTDNQVRIVAQLIDTITGGHLWSQRYDRPLKDIFALQDEIVQKIVTTLKLQISLQEQGYLVRKTTDNLEAYDYVLRGVESAVRFTKEANAQARQMFEKALALDPRYAEAYAFLGMTYWQAWVWQWSHDLRVLEQTFKLAQKAVALDDSLPVAHGVLGFAYVWQKQYEQAIAEAKRAITLDPNFADAYVWLADILNTSGRPQEAIGLIEKAMRLNPRYLPFYSITLGLAYYFTGRCEEAIATAKQVLSRNPNLPPAHALLGASYLQAWIWQWSPDPQALEWAFESAQRAVVLNDSLANAHGILGMVHLWNNQPEQAIVEAERAIALNPGDASSYAALGLILAYMGRSEEAVRSIEQALRHKPIISDLHLNSAGTAYYLAGWTEEAIAPLKQYLARYPNILGTHLTLAAVYSELGQAAEARAEAAEVLRLNPQFSLEVHKQRAPIKDPMMLERHLAALRKAGLK